MPTCYREAPDEIRNHVAKLATKFHPDLVEADVSIKILLAHNPDGSALTHASWPAKALVKINNLRDRVAGLPDATLMLDAEVFDGMSTEQQTSLIDHELTHLTVQRNKAGAFRYDDANRPKLRLRPHDWQAGGFDLMVQRHGVESHEAESINAIRGRWVQMELSF